MKVSHRSMSLLCFLNTIYMLLTVQVFCTHFIESWGCVVCDGKWSPAF